MNVLSVKNLTKKFGTYIAVDDISLELKEGEILGLLGPNGAGKTTTIQMLLGILTPSSGAIHYFEKDLQKHRVDILEYVNFSSTYTELPDMLTVQENLTYISYLYDIKNRKDRIKKIVDAFNLSALFHTQIQDLSEGQKTRVSLAKAFINYPKVLLLDEPTASLDPDTAKYIREFLLHERKQFNVSIIITSHNMSEVEEVCDRVIFIDHGKIIANDTPQNLAKTIKNSRVELMIKDGLKRAIEYCTIQNINHEVEGRYIIATIEEQHIPDFLRNLMDKGIFYDEISIDKPKLEDYFLHIVSENRNK
ncbi:MAG: ABC transporter ATP-binding protein [bacterium]|nr:ABC transporter ATP-binding protein [bacterium]